MSLRAAVEEDEPFLRRLFLESRRVMYPDLGETQVDELLELQHELRARQMRGFFPDALDHVIEIDGRVLGRVLVDVRDHDVHVVDIAVLESERHAGIATQVLAHWMQVADELGATVTIHVVNRPDLPDHLLAMGFSPIDVDGAGLVARRPAWMDRA